MTDEFYWIAVAVVVISSSARLTHLVTYDDFPPIKRLRDAFTDFTDKSPRLQEWQIVAYCGYCASFWMTMFVVMWGRFANWDSIWWLANGTLGASYLAAILMANDGEPEARVSD